MHPFLRALPFCWVLAGALAAPAPSQAGEAGTARVEVPGARIALEVHAVPGTSPHTVVLVVGGSGARTREDTAPALGFLLTPDIAVALYDRRGSGDSTGDYVRPSTGNSSTLVPREAGDVAALARHLAARGFETVDLVGSSFGAWVAVAAAARSETIDRVVCLSGAAGSVGISDEFDRLTDEGLSIADATARARTYAGEPGYDPHEDLVRMSQSGIWVMGLADESNPTLLDAERLDALRARGKAFNVRLLEGVDHDFRRTGTGEMATEWLAPVLAFLAGHDPG